MKVVLDQTSVAGFGGGEGVVSPRGGKSEKLYSLLVTKLKQEKTKYRGSALATKMQ